MTRTILFTAVAVSLLPAAPLLGQAEPAAANAEANAEFIRAAEAGGPRDIAQRAAVARLDPSGKVTPVRQGSNDFTCTLMPDGSNAPVCADEVGFRWLAAAMSKQPQPPSSRKPGIAYMAKGGIHFETPDGQIVMEPSAGTKEVKEPPHWMLLWPLDPEASGIPTRPNPAGSYIMFAGTPYAHLMIYQDPAKLHKK